MRRVVRRSGGWFVAALALALLSIPAVFDLRTLLVGLAVICGLLGLVTAAYTYADVARSGDLRRSAPRGPDEAAR